MLGGRFLIFCTVLLCLVGGMPTAADEPVPARVGRIAVADGNVALRLSGGEWADAGLNHPVAAGMSVRTAEQGRAILRIGAEAIALGGSTEVQLAQLDESGSQVVLRRGRIGVRLSELDPARSIEINIPRGGVWLLTPGDYDLTAGDEQAASRIAVLDGRAWVVGKGLDTAVATGSATVLTGNDPVVAKPDGAAADEFIAWWRPARGGDGDPPALRYVSAEMTGHEALDAHGSWTVLRGYGPVWFPDATPDDWAPFRHGHWRWIPPWGWSWIDDMAWGFAPSHYGRWARITGPDDDAERWGWVPGKLVADPAYLPAVVGFLGTAGVGLSYPNASRPAVAWFPLAPEEVYWPSFAQDLADIRRLNAGSVPDVSAIAVGVGDDPPADVVNGEYRNRSFATVVPRSVFVGGKPVAPSVVDLPKRRLENAPLLTGSPQIDPPSQRASATGGRVPAKLAKAVPTLDRVLKPAAKPPAVRKAVLTRSASPAAVKSARSTKTRATRPRIAAPAPRPAKVRAAGDRRR